MSEQSERQLDVTLEACKRQLLWAYAQYEGAMKTDEKYVATYWDGYIRAIQHLIEMDGKTKAVCPNCGAMETMIVTTYMHTDGYRVRRRHCTHCEQRFYTVQPPEKLLQPGTKAWYTRVKTCPQRLR